MHMQDIAALVRLECNNCSLPVTSAYLRRLDGIKLRFKTQLKT